MTDQAWSKQQAIHSPASPRVRRSWDPSLLVWVLAGLCLLILVVNPLVRLVLVSFSLAHGPGFTVANYVAAYSRARYWAALGNSLVLGLSTAALGALFGLPMAWAVARTNMPGKRLVWVSVLGAFVVPPYLGAVGWILLAGPNAGWLNRLVMALTGVTQGPFNVYSMPGLVLVVACSSFPYVFVFTQAALERIPADMEDAAHILGAGAWRTTLRITLPLALPAIAGALILVFLEAIALFGSPALIALPARFQVVTTQMWEFFEQPPRVEVAAAYAMPLLGITVALFLVQRLVLGRKGYVTLTGKGGERRLLALGKGRWLLLGYCLGVCSLSTYLPLLVLGQAAFAKAWGRGLAWGNWTLDNVAFVLTDQATSQRALVNTFVYAGVAACIAMALALCIAYGVQRRLLPWGQAWSALTMAPFVIPGIVLAIGFYSAYVNPPLRLYGTAWILILAFATRFLPIAFVNTQAALGSVHPELEDAVRILGGGRLVALRRVVLPLLKRGLAGGFLLVFIPATRELSSAIFLYTVNTRVLSVLLFDKSDEGNFELLAAIGLVLVVATVLLAALGFRIAGRDFLFRRGSG